MGMDRRSFGRFLFGISSVSLSSLESALAASYPEKPITFICPWPAGGTADDGPHPAPDQPAGCGADIPEHPSVPFVECVGQCADRIQPAHTSGVMEHGIASVCVRRGGAGDP